MPMQVLSIWQALVMLICATIMRTRVNMTTSAAFSSLHSRGNLSLVMARSAIMDDATSVGVALPGSAWRTASACRSICVRCQRWLLARRLASLTRVVCLGPLNRAPPFGLLVEGVDGAERLSAAVKNRCKCMQNKTQHTVSKLGVLSALCTASEISITFNASADLW